MNQRLVLALAGAILIVMYFVIAVQSGWNGARESFFANICARAGLVTLAAALAWPQLTPLGRRFPLWFWGTIGLALLIVVIRPRLVVLAVALVVIVSVAHGGIRWISKFLREK